MRGFNQVEILIENPLNKDAALTICRALNKKFKYFYKASAQD